MKFNIKTDGFISSFSLESRVQEENLNSDEKKPAELNIKASVHKKEIFEDKEYITKLEISIKTDAFVLNLTHQFFIEFERKLRKADQESDKVRNLLINNLYPYSRAFIISTLSNGGYGSVNVPIFTL
ncbi:hypothetical protein [Pasteurella multocida]|uniref:hypothetical protein n=1 Tax=Pasteurella multocida TaxID=747 RepID=UPI00397DA720